MFKDPPLLQRTYHYHSQLVGPVAARQLTRRGIDSTPSDRMSLVKLIY